ncbi:NUDIX domain-containing protein [Bradyrhizobium sp. 2TAF24]|uniref:NUDIX domain-containing protein n=1 Tax=Bradyrhizobium sp. 2TAF24 TaxID=3233011 RepID=UPI003F9342EE
MPTSSAGVLIYRQNDGALQVLLVHPGGPLWRNRDLGAWSIPKGEIEPGANAEETARREVNEELGLTLTAPLRPLGEVRQRGGKRVIGFACASDLNAAAVTSNTFEMEWPPGSGHLRAFPEVDRAQWFDLTTAGDKILDGQRPFLARLQAMLVQCRRSP